MMTSLQSAQLHYQYIPGEDNECSVMGILWRTVTVIWRTVDLNLLPKNPVIACKQLCNPGLKWQISHIPSTYSYVVFLTHTQKLIILNHWGSGPSIWGIVNWMENHTEWPSWITDMLLSHCLSNVLYLLLYIPSRTQGNTKHKHCHVVLKNFAFVARTLQVLQAAIVQPPLTWIVLKMLLCRLWASWMPQAAAAPPATTDETATAWSC